MLFVVNRKGKIKIQMKKKPDSLKNRKGNENSFDTKKTNLK